MKIGTPDKLRIVLATVLAFIGASAKADTFGSGANVFTIDFVNIGNEGNADDAGAGGGSWSSPYGGVTYSYRMGVYEISQEAIIKATANGLTNVTSGPWSGNLPATETTWYEAAAFVNWLNTSTGHHSAYDLNWTGSAWTMNLWSSEQTWQAGGENRYRHKDAYYFLPNEDEWYKSAYHKNDGVTANYWDFATGSNSIPIPVFGGRTAFTVVYWNDALSPTGVDNNGGLSAYGTLGQNGNISEWLESAYDGSNSAPSLSRAYRGGWWGGSDNLLRSSVRLSNGPAITNSQIGFRVAGTPEEDADRDGIPDRYETGTGIYVSPTDTGTNPNNPDSDGDGLTDGQEVNSYHTNPNVKDTDSDGFEDGFEISTGFDPTSAASTPDALSSIRVAAEYRFNAALGVSYRIEASTDLSNWQTIETPIVGNGGVITRLYSTNGQPKRFFRSLRN